MSGCDQPGPYCHSCGAPHLELISEEEDCGGSSTSLYWCKECGQIDISVGGMDYVDWTEEVMDQSGIGLCVICGDRWTKLKCSIDKATDFCCEGCEEHLKENNT